ADLQGTPTDQTSYRRMIGGLMYLTVSRPNIAFATFVCARYQARPKDSGFKPIAYSYADDAGCKDDCKRTSGGLQFLGGKLENVEKGTVELYFVRIEYQLADLFTSALLKERFEYLVHLIGMRCMTPTQLESPDKVIFLKRSYIKNM
ncbi:hypothetical protein Tco_0101256, partial [Tanacetum coccineum]